MSEKESCDPKGRNSAQSVLWAVYLHWHDFCTMIIDVWGGKLWPKGQEFGTKRLMSCLSALAGFLNREGNWYRRDGICDICCFYFHFRNVNITVSWDTLHISWLAEYLHKCIRNNICIFCVKLLFFKNVWIFLQNQWTSEQNL